MKGCSQQPRLHNSFKKYGIDKHAFEIIEECSKDLLNTKERYWQEAFDVLGKNGLNCRLTGTSDKSGKMSEKTKQKLSAINKELAKHKTYTANKTSFMQGHIPWNKDTTGLIVHTVESNEKRRNTCINSNKNSIPVLQYTKSGEFIKRWRSARAAGINMRKSSGSAITECCMNKRKSIYGYVWKYETGGML